MALRPATSRKLSRMKMLPLIDGAGYKLFDAKMFSLTDGASNKLFGTKMKPHLSTEVGQFHEVGHDHSAGLLLSHQRFVFRAE